MSSPPRFHVPGAAPGARLALPEHAAHHAREVLRLRSGAPCASSTARARSSRPASTRCRAGRVFARLGAAVAPRAESPLRLVLAVSPLKGDRMELVVQKATELGVAGDLARGHVPHGRRGPSRPAGLARRALGARRLGRRRAVRARGRARGRADHDPGRSWSRGRSTAGGSCFSRPRATRRSPRSRSTRRGPLLLLVGPAGGFEPVRGRGAPRGRLHRGLPRPPHPARRDRRGRRGRDRPGACGATSEPDGRSPRRLGPTPAPAAP